MNGCVSDARKEGVESMSDRYLADKRSAIMSRVRAANTRPEIAVRRLFHQLGYRFRLHRRDLPGTPDLVLPKYRAVVFGMRGIVGAGIAVLNGGKDANAVANRRLRCVPLGQ